MLTPYLITIGLFILMLLAIAISFGGKSRSKNGDDTGRYNLFSPGDSGEYAVARQLRRLSDEYMVLNDLLLRSGNGHTTQIDHVVVSPFGIFVIETKNISGQIYGNTNAQQWKRYLHTWWYGVHRTHHLEFNNPILQNKAHIVVLARTLSHFEHARLVSVIAFSPKAELKIYGDTTNIIYWSDVRRFIRQYKTPIMTSDEANCIYNYLREINIKGEQARDAHAERVSMLNDRQH